MAKLVATDAGGSRSWKHKGYKHVGFNKNELISIASADMASIAARLPTQKQAMQVAARAVNRALVAGRTEAARQLNQRYALRVRQINELVSVGKIQSNSVSARVTWRGRAVNIAQYRASPAKPNPAKRPKLRAMVDKAAGMRSYHPAFLLNTKSGVKAFRRVSGSGRYPVTQVYGPAIPQLLDNQTLRSLVMARAGEVLESRIEHEITRELMKGGR